MAQLLNSFNPMDFDPSQGAGALPLGKHPVIIESAEVKGTKDNSGGYLQLNLRIIEGPNAGTTGVYRLNLYNQSQDACNIAHRQLSAVCHVTQTFQLGQDGTQVQFLFNKPFVIEVGPQKGAEAQEKGYTEIKRVFDMAGNEPGKTGQVQQQGNGNAAAFNQQPAASSAPANGQQGGAQAWGGQPAGQPQGGAPGGGWGQQGNSAPAADTPPAQSGWQQQGNAAPAGGQPSWGQRS